MARRKRGVHLILGVIIGLLFGFCIRQYHIENRCSFNNYILKKSKPIHPLEIIDMPREETPNNSRNALVFVGVMTAQNFLQDRAQAVWNTWGQSVPGRLAFFSSEGSQAEGVPLVALDGVDDRYPPQKKSFMMLNYMYENYIDSFEWFLRADDDVYIRTDKLEKLLRSVDSRKPQFIGQAGRGNSEDFGHLSLEYDENFCMGGPGVIISRETLRRVAPHIKYCLSNLYSTHEDVELGRCVRKFAGIPCTWNYEMQSVLHHNSSGSRAFSGNLKTREVHRAISLHPVKLPPLMFRLHAYMMGLKIQHLQQDRIDLHRDISAMDTELGLPASKVNEMELAPGVPLYPITRGRRGYLGDSTVLGVKPGLNRYYPRTVEDVIPWQFVSRTLYSHQFSNPKRRIEISVKEGLDDVIREIMENINTFSRQRGRVIAFRELLYGYERLDPLHGHDVMLDLLLVYKKYRGRKMTVPVRRHAYLQQAFTGLEIREVSSPEESFTSLDFPMEIDYETDNTYTVEQPRNFLLNLPIKQAIESSIMKISEKLNFMNNRANVINFILPLSGRFTTFKRFMETYESVCLKTGESVAIYISLFSETKDPNDFEKTINLVNYFKSKYRSAKLEIIQMHTIEFSRAIALESAISVCEINSLLLLIDVDMIFNKNALRNIRTNTILNRQVYFPIVYSEYDSSITNSIDYNLELKENNSFDNHFDINEQNGYFRQFGFGIVSIYKSDLNLVGGLNSDIKGWGLEDVRLYDKLVSSNLTIFRAADPNFIHIYHPVECDVNLEAQQLKMCETSKSSTYASYKQLEIYFRKHNDVLEFAKKRSLPAS